TLSLFVPLCSAPTPTPTPTPSPTPTPTPTPTPRPGPTPSPTPTPTPGPGTTPSPTPQPPGGGDGGGGSCGGLLWTAVLLLAAGILALAFHLRLGAAGAYVFVAGWAAIALYGILMGVWALLSWIGICKSSRCEAAKIHLLILSPLL